MLLHKQKTNQNTFYI